MVRADASKGDSNQRVATSWMKKEPKDGEATYMTKKGMQFWWCPTHKLWQCYLPDKCRKKKKLEEQTESNNNGYSDKAESDKEEHPSRHLNHIMQATTHWF